MDNNNKNKDQEPSGSGYKVVPSGSNSKRRESSDSANKTKMPVSKDTGTPPKIVDPHATNQMTPTGPNASNSVADKEATVMETLPKRKRNRGKKRPRQTPDGLTTPSPSVQAPAKRPKGGEQSSSSYSEMAATVKMALVPESFPMEKLTKDQAIDIQDQMNVLIDEIEDENQPLFSTVGWVNGALMVHCIGAPTVDWLKANLQGKTVKDIQLRVVTAAELPKPVKLILKTRDTRTHDSAVLLKRLGKQNRGLITGEWRILAKEKGLDHIRWIFEIDQDSAKSIRERNLELFCGAFGKGLCKLIEAPPPKPQSAAEDVEMSEAASDTVTPAVVTPADENLGDAEEANPSDASDQVSVGNLLENLEIGSEHGSDTSVVTMVSSTELLANLEEFNEDKEGSTPNLPTLVDKQ